jgi:hypothetical protein
MSEAKWLERFRNHCEFTEDLEAYNGIKAALEQKAALGADNAALLEHVRASASVACETTDIEMGCGSCMSCMARELVAAPHPGAALLAEHEKAITKAWRDAAGVVAMRRRSLEAIGIVPAAKGVLDEVETLLLARAERGGAPSVSVCDSVTSREHAKALVRARNEGLGLSALAVSRAKAKSATGSEAFALLDYAEDCINAMKESEE